MSKIHSSLPPPVQVVTNAPKRGGTNAADAAKAGSEASATPSPLLSSGTLTTRAPASPEAPVDAAKVAKLRAVVLDGSYKADAQSIADRLVNLEKALP